MIPPTHYLVPLLHTINKKIECLDKKEIQTQKAVIECEKIIAWEVMSRTE